MTFLLTKTTDPKTIMFEGRPDIDILAISDKCAPMGGGVAVYIAKTEGFDHDWTAGMMHTNGPRMHQQTHSNYTYNPNGTVRSKNCNWPRIVQRRVLDASKPLSVRLIKPGVTSQAELDARGYEITGRLLPAVGDEPELFLIKGQPGSELKIDPRTGRTVHRSGVGSNLEFFNAPTVRTITRNLEVYGYMYPLTITLTDENVTSIEWNKK